MNRIEMKLIFLLFFFFFGNLLRSCTFWLKVDGLSLRDRYPNKKKGRPDFFDSSTVFLTSVWYTYKFRKTYKSVELSIHDSNRSMSEYHSSSVMRFN